MLKQNKMVKFNPTKETFVAFGTGIVIIGLSFLMLLFRGSSFIEQTLYIILRNVLMILIIGFLFPLYYTFIKNKEQLTVFGIKKAKFKISILLNIIFAIGLFFIFFMKLDRKLNPQFNDWCAITYIMVAGVFEMVLFYGFLRYYFEKAFGIIPAIILTALFYSLHHAGFQPEFLKLFFVGIMYVATYYITRNIFIIFPFFWGIGATWDVLINSISMGEDKRNLTILFIACIMLICMVLISIFVIKKRKSFFH